MQGFLQKVRSFSRELKRRRVYRVTAYYAAGAFAVLQGADLLAGALLLPNWVVAALAIVAVIGFPVAVAISWAFQVTPEGVRPEEPGGDRDMLRWGLRGGVVGVVLLASMAAGWTSWTYWLEPGVVQAGDTVAMGGAGEESGAPDPARIAVLYFDDHSQDGDMGYLADGITEGLLHELAQIPALTVVSRNAMKAHRDGAVPLDSLLRSLRVGSLVEGSVAESAGRVRVTVQLIDAVTGVHLASRVLERPITELFALQDDLTEEVARVLRQQLGDEIRTREERRGATSVEAWRLYRLAEELREEDRRLWRAEAAVRVLGLLEADSLLARAERLDPEWAQPTIARAWIANGLARINGDPPGVGMDATWAARALQHADRAISIGPDAAAGLEVRGAILAGLARTAEDPERAREEAGRVLERAVALDPMAARAWGELAAVRVAQGRFPEARRGARRALQADAFLEDAAEVTHTLYFSALHAGPEPEAVEQCNDGRARFPAESEFVVCQLFLLASFPQVEPDVDRAWALVDTLETLVAERTRAGFHMYGAVQVAKVAARAGLPDSARAILQRARGEETPEWLAYDEAHARLLLGEEDHAIRLLRQYLDAGADPAFLARDWWFADLRDDPRFQALVGADAGG